jgi:hypothetical protein
LLIRSSRIVVTVIAAQRTFIAQLAKCEPAGLYGSLRPMPSSRYTQPSCRTTAAVERADVLRGRKSGGAIPRDDFGLGDP